MREFDLNIEKVLENWTVAHAIREVIANALDERIITGTRDVEIVKDLNGVWHIRDYGRGLQYVHLTQNENDEKQTRQGLIGKFGVGLKDALATFDRHDVEVVIDSKFGRITTGKSVKHGFSDITTLHAYISDPVHEDFVGTDVQLRGCTDEDVDRAKDFFLKFADLSLYESTQYGEVYGKRNDKAEIFINGIKVAEEDNLLFSYNITSLTAALRKAINRERTNVGRSAYSDRLKSILLEVRSDKVVKALTVNLTQMNSGLQCDEMKWVDVQAHAVKLLNVGGAVVFVTPEEINKSSGTVIEIIRESGKTPVFVPDTVKQRIVNEKDVAGRAISTISTVVESYNNSFEYDFIPYERLDKHEKEIFDLVPEVLRIMGSKVTRSQVYVSAKMKQDESGSILGLWEGGKVIILRSQLRNREEFLGTLIHELTHADSGADDICREFESALTKRLGKLASMILPHFTKIPEGLPPSQEKSLAIAVTEYELNRVVKCSRSSSLLSAPIVYDYSTRRMFLKIRNFVYCYHEVPNAVAENMFVAESIGCYFNAIINRYPTEYGNEDEFGKLLMDAVEYN